GGRGGSGDRRPGPAGGRDVRGRGLWPSPGDPRVLRRPRRSRRRADPAKAHLGGSIVTAIAVDQPLDLRATWLRIRLPVVLALLLVAVAVAAAWLSNAPPRRPLDPRDAAPQGGRALATLLTARGVSVTGTADVSTVVADAPSTVFVPDPGSLTVTALQELAASPASLVLVAPGRRELEAVGASVSPVDDVNDVTPQPGCGLRAATVAGSIRFSGVVYSGGDAACYHESDGAGLITVGRGNGGETTVLGSATTLSNADLGD